MTIESNGGTTLGNESTGDLTQIKGIGPAKRQWLQDELEISSIQDLARASANQIYRRLRDAGHSISQNEIRNWMAQAEAALEKKSAQEITPERPETDADSSPTKSGSLALPGKVSQGELPSSGQKVELHSGRDDWSTLATFSVAFQSRAIEGGQEVQTVARHLEQDNSRAWPGLNNEGVQLWMLEQIQVVTSTSKSSTVPAKISAASAKQELQQFQVKYIYLVQPNQTGSPIVFNPEAKTVLGCLSADRSFSLEFLIGHGKHQTQPLDFQESFSPCRIQLGAKRLTPPRGNKVIEETVSMTWVSDKSLLRMTLHNLQLSEGLYLLEALISFPDFNGFSIFAKIPRLQVV
jgi:predicted flap endonuclease-1-like 5' DNA nuclease